MATHEVTEEMTVKAARLCAEFMGGSWAGITRCQLVVDRVKGGLSNEIYKCSLAEQVGNSLILYSRIENRIFYSSIQKNRNRPRNRNRNNTGVNGTFTQLLRLRELIIE